MVHHTNSIAYFKMSTEQKVVDSPPSNGSDKEGYTHDHEKAIPPGGTVGATRQPGVDGVPSDFRELDFMTRNGLNARSFTRRKSSLPRRIRC